MVDTTVIRLVDHTVRSIGFVLKFRIDKYKMVDSGKERKSIVITVSKLQHFMPESLRTIL